VELVVYVMGRLRFTLNNSHGLWLIG
jgi:hypothetical protein